MTRASLALALLLVLPACSAPLPDHPASAAHRSTSALPLPPAPPPPPMPEAAGSCAADVHPCSDGSYVRRSADNDCAFDACPGTPHP